MLRQSKGKNATAPRTTLSRDKSRWIRTHDSLLSRQALYYDTVTKYWKLCSQLSERVISESRELFLCALEVCITAHGWDLLASYILLEVLKAKDQAGISDAVD